MAALTTSLKIDTSGFIASIKQAAASVQGLNSATSQPMGLKIDASQAKATIESISEKIKGAAGELGGIGSSILGVFGGGVLLGGVSGIIGGFDKIISKGKAAIEMQEDMKVAFRASGLSAEQAEKAVSKNAKTTGELSNKYAISKKDINEATAAFLRFGGSSEDLGKKQENIIGLAARMGGNYELAARALAKATDPEIEGQLTKFGIKFEKNATEADRQRIITEKLGGTLAGLADKADTPLGKMQRVQNAIGGIASTIGVAVIESVAPIVGLIGDVVLPLIQNTIGAIKSIISSIKGFFTANADAIGVVLSVIAVGAVIAAAALYGGLIPSVIASASSFIVMGVAAAAAWIAVNLPIIAIIASIAALSAGIIYLYNNFEGVRNAIKVIKDIAVVVFEGLIQYAKDYWEILKAVGEIVFTFMILPFKLLWAVLSPVISAIGKFIGNFLGLGGAASSAGGSVDFLKKGFEVLHNVMGFVISALKGVIAGISTFAETATKVIDKVMSLDFSGAVDAAKEGGKKIGESTATAFNESMGKIKSEDAAKKFADDFIKAAEEAKLAIASLNTVKLGENFDAAKTKAESAAKSAITQSSGLQLAAENLRAVERGNEAEKKKALEDFVKATDAVAAQDSSKSESQNLTYEQAIELAKKTQKALAKAQKDGLDESRHLKKIESANNIEDQEKENQKAIENTGKRAKLKSDKEKFELEKLSKTKLISEEEQAVKSLQIQAEADKKNFDQQILTAKKLQSANKTATGQERATAQIAIDQLEFDKVKSVYDSENKIRELKGKAAIKVFEDAQKRQAEFSKAEIERAKTLSEKIALAEKSATTGAGVIAAIRATGEAKRRLIELQNDEEINMAIDKNAAVIKANELLKKAITSGDTGKIDTASAAVLEAINTAEKTDAAVLAVKDKNTEALIKADKDQEARIAEARIALIENSVERELQTKLAALKKQYEADLDLFKGNESAKNDLTRDYDAKRYDAELDAQNKSRVLAVIALNSMRDFGLGMANSIRDSMGNTFNDLNKTFDDFAANIRKKITDAGQDNSSKTAEEGKKLAADLKAHIISYQDFQAKSAALNKQKNAENVTTTEQANLAIGSSFQAMAKTGQAGIDASLKSMSTGAKAFAKVYSDTASKKEDKDEALKSGWKSFGASMVDTGNSMMTGIIGVWGQLAATGKLTLENAGAAAVAMTLDTVSSIVMANSVAIMSYAMASPLGLIGGAIAGALAIATVVAMLAAAKSSIMGKHGFSGGGYTGDVSPNSVAGAVHGREVVFESAITSGNKDGLLALRAALQGGTKLSDIIGNVQRSQSFVDAGGKLNTSQSNIFSDVRSDRRLKAAEYAVANTGKTAINSDFSTMQKSLINIEKLLAKPSRHTTTSAVQIKIEENQAFKATQHAQALRLERGRK